MLESKNALHTYDIGSLENCIRLCSIIKSTLPSDSKTFRSESDIFGQVPLKIVTFSVSPIGDWLYGVRTIVVVLVHFCNAEF